MSVKGTDYVRKICGVKLSGKRRELGATVKPRKNRLENILIKVGYLSKQTTGYYHKIHQFLRKFLRNFSRTSYGLYMVVNKGFSWTKILFEIKISGFWTHTYPGIRIKIFNFIFTEKCVLIFYLEYNIEDNWRKFALI